MIDRCHLLFCRKVKYKASLIYRRTYPSVTVLHLYSHLIYTRYWTHKSLVYLAVSNSSADRTNYVELATVVLHGYDTPAPLVFGVQVIVHHPPSKALQFCSTHHIQQRLLLDFCDVRYRAFHYEIRLIVKDHCTYFWSEWAGPVYNL